MSLRVILSTLFFMSSAAYAGTGVISQKKSNGVGVLNTPEALPIALQVVTTNYDSTFGDTVICEYSVPLRIAGQDLTFSVHFANSSSSDSCSNAEGLDVIAKWKNSVRGQDLTYSYAMTKTLSYDSSGNQEEQTHCYEITDLDVDLQLADGTTMSARSPISRVEVPFRACQGKSASSLQAVIQTVKKDVKTGELNPADLKVSGGFSVQGGIVDDRGSCMSNDQYNVCYTYCGFKQIASPASLQVQFSSSTLIRSPIGVTAKQCADIKSVWMNEVSRKRLSYTLTTFDTQSYKAKSGKCYLMHDYWQVFEVDGIGKFDQGKETLSVGAEVSAKLCE